MDKSFEELDTMSLPFNYHFIPLKFPQPQEFLS